ncbi:MgtC/SapB family protein [Sphingorhabdus sp. SMR4y]|uniref:MgtC/SapB family protein n=1 Tax=Sphingorhabdus sp. SMR4y TaxID=2584094 RepID=UPI000B5C9706|nr:MgtC/SapB family protein [Sphingorhabdus sp. SMR4y]ASK87392.1 membrane protein [Sphingorhabdus sp. SMR4y]
MLTEFSGEWLVYRDLAIALAAGLLIGVERGWTMRDEEEGSRVAGIRTFGLIAGLGGLVALIAQSLSLVISAILLTGVVTMLSISHFRTIHEPDGRSITNFVVSLLTLCLGLVAGSGFPALAMAGAAIVTGLLSLRSELHGLMRRLGPTDIKVMIRFALIALAVLPFLPERDFGPYDAFNLQQLWFVVILVTGLSFAGYVANRLFGAQHGTVVTAVIGGAYSSTAVTASLAQRLRGEDSNGRTLSAGIALASSVMYVRVLLLTFILARFAFVPLAMILTPAALVAAVIGLLLLRRSGAARTDESVETRNPVRLLPAFFFALTVAAMSLAARWAETEFGTSGIAYLVLIMGSFDVDAAIITLGALPADTIMPKLAGFVLAMTVLANMLFKAAVAGVTAGWKSGRSAVAALLASSIVLAGAGLWSFLVFDIRF